MNSDDTDSFVVDPTILHCTGVLVPYKVQSGDTLESIAARIGSTWQSVAQLNWGTDNQDMVNWHLKEHVGCTKMEGGRYQFDSDNTPGIVLLPDLPPPSEPAPSQEFCATIRVCRYPIEE